jgi:ribosomal protein S18 acetylase RimI-like enzyme
MPADTGGILRLYRRVASFPGGLARLEDEIDEPYVRSFVTRSLDNGIAQVVEAADGRVIGEIHAYSPGLYCFAHVLTDLTIAVDPGSQGSGIGRLLFQSLLNRVVDERPDIERVELIARESNEKALLFYESLGFRREGHLSGRIRNVDGSIECDIPMGWQRPT